MRVLSMRASNPHAVASQGALLHQEQNIKNHETNSLVFASLPSKEQFEQEAGSNGFYIASRAKHLIQTIERMGQLDPTYPYPVDVWRLGGLTWVFLGSEVTVDDSLRIKRNLGSATSSHGAHI